MKNLKIGFVSIIAVLTICLTVASQAGVFNASLKRASIPDGCYKNVINNLGMHFNSGDDCPLFLPFNTNVDDGNATNLLPNPEVNCATPTTPLCCVQLKHGVMQSFVCGTALQ
ncbi:hypothetical protein [Chitinophaga defluvii]|uniref:Uncharacterized protein n=1 Tax=Chitinophaga defluvii TaxID=3163343 RepID=A0ABV2TCG9_9BACT